MTLQISSQKVNSEHLALILQYITFDQIWFLFAWKQFWLKNISEF